MKVEKVEKVEVEVEVEVDSGGMAMNAQNVITDSRVLHIRELKTENARIKSENSRLRDENAMLKAHLDLAITAAEDLKDIEDGGKYILIDGWNLILGTEKIAKDRKDLERIELEYLENHPKDFVWIVLDGPRFATKQQGRLRVTYTGGSGEHRADRFICDILRMAMFRGDQCKIRVETYDRDFRKRVDKILFGA